MKWPDRDQPPACWRLRNWLSRQDTLHVKYSQGSPDADTNWIGRVAAGLRSAARPLVWLESCDVDAARAGLHLAETTGATIHVAQSPGEHLVSTVSSALGWQGTSLAELRYAATLVVHVGHQHLREMPMLLARFKPSDCEHVFLDQCPTEILEDELAGERHAITELKWSREQWLDGMLRTLLAVRDESAVGQRVASELDVTAGLLAERLLGNRYSVILWNQSELTDDADRLLIERLVELSDSVGQINRCSLLPLASDPGRVTAKDTVLWLTNRTTPLEPSSNGWIPADYSSGLSLDQWQAQFDYRLCIRTLPSDCPLPELSFHSLIDADRNPGQLPHRENDVCYVRSVGVNAPGHLTRGDHGLAAYAQSIEDDQASRPLASEVIYSIREAYKAESSRGTVEREAAK